MTAHVDRGARNCAAQILRDFISGRITNDQFCDTFPVSKDPAIDQIFQATWPHYDDLREHRLTGSDALHPVNAREMLRWILFLDSDLPYVWPKSWNPQNAQVTGRRSWLDMLLRRKSNVAFLSAGDATQWPFACRANVKHALRHPKRLNGHTV